MTDSGAGAKHWDFFVSFQQADRAWAEWISWQLEDAGYTVLFQLWDFTPGTNWIKLMQDGVNNSTHVIAVLSPAYCGSVFASAEWQSAWIHDPAGAKRRIIPVRVTDCKRTGLLAGIVSIDLFDVTEPKAIERMRNAARRAMSGRSKPISPPEFPGTK